MGVKKKRKLEEKKAYRERGEAEGRADAPAGSLKAV